jgi:hypothetical protein
MKARIYNGEWAGNHSNNWINANQDKEIGGQLVSEWTLTEVLPTEEEKVFIKLMFDGSEYYEGATPEEIAEANKPIVPQTARSMNFRLVLIQNGITMQSIYDLIASLPSPQNELGYQMFEYATHYDRNNAMINALAQMMGVSQEQLDDFFIQSEKLVI